ncbi:hypothetical protein BDR26DRAFT_840021 [Obelidium mucronatum]|nr:hypothetical protein BDR26DRAFT_840021 [Obelidium mucronatum]
MSKRIPARWKVSDAHSPAKGLVRMSWHALNVFNAAAAKPKPGAAAARASVFQQKWAAKRATRAYHVPNISERQLLARHWKSQLPLVQMRSKAETENQPPVQALAFAELERRLDVVLFRSHFASSINQARTQVVHGHVSVNGEKCPYPARRLKPGDLVSVDPKVVATLLPKSRHPKSLPFNPLPFMAPFMFTPAYLEVCYNTCSTVFLRTPLPQPTSVEIPSPHPPDMHALAYEWYSSIKRAKTKRPPSSDPLVVNGRAVRLKSKFESIVRARLKQERDDRWSVWSKRDEDARVKALEAKNSKVVDTGASV